MGLTANGAAGWGFIGEISSQRLRPYTAGFGAATTCVAGIAMGQLTPYMVNRNEWNWGLKTGWFYGGVGLIFASGMWFLIPETAGLVYMFPSFLSISTNQNHLGDLLPSLTSSSIARLSPGVSTRPRPLPSASSELKRRRR